MRMYSSSKPLQLRDAAEYVLKYTGVGWCNADDNYKYYTHRDQEHPHPHRKRSPREKDQIDELQCFCGQIGVATDVNKENIQTYERYITNVGVLDEEGEYSDDESGSGSEEESDEDFEDDFKDDIEDDTTYDPQPEDSMAEQKRKQDLRLERQKRLERESDHTYLYAPPAVRKEAARIARQTIVDTHAREKEQRIREYHERMKDNQDVQVMTEEVEREMRTRRTEEKKKRRAERVQAREKSDQEDGRGD
ncbi:hypothetical protein F5Y18DRAFT_377992 [Xylariaceae sp. FL1019]|nr:hypothetical protein F5Y18DRAFT_377992 [Xylariaceae sp. FL1019]